jgi:hypothetical protein
MVKTNAALITLEASSFKRNFGTLIRQLDRLIPGPSMAYGEALTGGPPIVTRTLIAGLFLGPTTVMGGLTNSAIHQGGTAISP